MPGQSSAPDSADNRPQHRRNYLDFICRRKYLAQTTNRSRRKDRFRDPLRDCGQLGLHLDEL